MRGTCPCPQGAHILEGKGRQQSKPVHKPEIQILKAAKKEMTGTLCEVVQGCSRERVFLTTTDHMTFGEI